MSAHERKKLLRTSVSHAVQSYIAWLEDQDVRYVTTELEESIDMLIEVFKTGDMPFDYREIWGTVTEIETAWNKWRDDHDRNDGAVPGELFMKKMNELMSRSEKVKHKAIKQIEPIPVLLEQKVTIPQIARMYNWYLDPDTKTQPDMQKVYEELEKPGTHTGENYEDPVAQRQREKMEAIHRKANELMQKSVSKGKKQTIAPESIEDLIRDNVPAQQICLMKDISTEELEAYCEENGLNMPRAAETIHDLKSQYAQDINESGQRILDQMGGPQLVEEPPATADDAEKIKQAIIDLYNQDNEIPPSQIAEIVSDQLGMKVPYQKVNRVLKGEGLK
jgi:hypothetical protein